MIEIRRCVERARGRPRSPVRSEMRIVMLCGWQSVMGLAALK